MALMGQRISFSILTCCLETRKYLTIVCIKTILLRFCFAIVAHLQNILFTNESILFVIAAHNVSYSILQYNSFLFCNSFATYLVN